MRLEMLWNGGNIRTTEDIEDRTSGPDMELLTLMYDKLVERESRKQKAIVNNAVWGEK